MSYQIAQGYKYIGNDRWSWRVWIDASDSELDKIKQVTWYLHHTFREPVVIKKKKSRSEKFILKRKGWGVFQIRAELSLNDGSSDSLTHWLELAYPSSDTEVVTRSGQPDTFDKKNKIFLSYGAEDQRLATELRGKLEERGYEVLDPINIQKDVPIEAATNKMIRDSDLVMGFVTSDFANPSVLMELNKANKSQKPTLAVIKKGIEQPYGLDQRLNRVELDLGSINASDELADILGKFTL
jgi:transcription initiation factor IIF auxiliary subunit